MGPHYHGPETVPPEEFPEQEEEAVAGEVGSSLLKALEYLLKVFEAGGGEVGFNSTFENNLRLQERLD